MAITTNDSETQAKTNQRQFFMVDGDLVVRQGGEEQVYTRGLTGMDGLTDFFLPDGPVITTDEEGNVFDGDFATKEDLGNTVPIGQINLTHAQPEPDVAGTATESPDPERTFSMVDGNLVVNQEGEEQVFGRGPTDTKGLTNFSLPDGTLMTVDEEGQVFDGEVTWVGGTISDRPVGQVDPATLSPPEHEATPAAAGTSDPETEYFMDGRDLVVRQGEEEQVFVRGDTDTLGLIDFLSSDRTIAMTVDEEGRVFEGEATWVDGVISDRPVGQVDPTTLYPPTPEAATEDVILERAFSFDDDGNLVVSQAEEQTTYTRGEEDTKGFVGFLSEDGQQITINTNTGNVYDGEVWQGNASISTPVTTLDDQALSQLTAAIKQAENPDPERTFSFDDDGNLVVRRGQEEQVFGRGETDSNGLIQFLNHEGGLITIDGKDGNVFDGAVTLESGVIDAFPVGQIDPAALVQPEPEAAPAAAGTSDPEREFEIMSDGRLRVTAGNTQAFYSPDFTDKDGFTVFIPDDGNGDLTLDTTTNIVYTGNVFLDGNDVVQGAAVGTIKHHNGPSPAEQGVDDPTAAAGNGTLPPAVNGEAARTAAESTEPHPTIDLPEFLFSAGTPARGGDSFQLSADKTTLSRVTNDGETVDYVYDPDGETLSGVTAYSCAGEEPLYVSDRTGHIFLLDKPELKFADPVIVGTVGQEVVFSPNGDASKIYAFANGQFPVVLQYMGADERETGEQIATYRVTLEDGTISSEAGPSPAVYAIPSENRVIYSATPEDSQTFTEYDAPCLMRVAIRVGDELAQHNEGPPEARNAAGDEVARAAAGTTEDTFTPHPDHPIGQFPKFLLEANPTFGQFYFELSIDTKTLRGTNLNDPEHPSDFTLDSDERENAISVYKDSSDNELYLSHKNGCIHASNIDGPVIGTIDPELVFSANPDGSTLYAYVSGLPPIMLECTGAERMENGDVALVYQTINHDKSKDFPSVTVHAIPGRNTVLHSPTPENAETFTGYDAVGIEHLATRADRLLAGDQEQEARPQETAADTPPPSPDGSPEPAARVPADELVPTFRYDAENSKIIITDQNGSFEASLHAVSTNNIWYFGKEGEAQLSLDITNGDVYRGHINPLSNDSIITEHDRKENLVGELDNKHETIEFVRRHRGNAFKEIQAKRNQELEGNRASVIAEAEENGLIERGTDGRLTINSGKGAGLDLFLQGKAEEGLIAYEPDSFRAKILRPQNNPPESEPQR